MRRRIRKSSTKSAESLNGDERKAEIVRPKPRGSSVRERIGTLEKQSVVLRATAEAIDLQRDVVNLNGQGLPIQEIAEALGLKKTEVVHLLARGLEEYHADRNEAVQKYLAVTVHRYNRIFQTWLPKCEDHYEKRVIGGKEEDVFIAADPEATRIVLRALNDFNRMMGFNKIRVEHTGANGTPLVDPNQLQHLTDEQLEKARSGDTRVLGSLPRSTSD